MGSLHLSHRNLDPSRLQSDWSLASLDEVGHSGLFLAQGIITTLLGIAALIWPRISSLAVELYVGWLFLLSGVMGLIVMFFAPNVAGFLWTLLTAALSLFAGVLLLWHPVEGVVSLTLLLVAFFAAEGVFQIAAAFGYRSAFPESWVWMLLSGVADIILAFLLIGGWPGSASWALGVIVGVNLHHLGRGDHRGRKRGAPGLPLRLRLLSLQWEQIAIWTTITGRLVRF